MSFSFTVPSGPAAEFADRAAKAKADVEAASEANDYALTQLASSTADLAIKAATELVRGLGEGVASGSIGGHHDDRPGYSSNVSVGVSVTNPAEPTDADSPSTSAPTI